MKAEENGQEAKPIKHNLPLTGRLVEMATSVNEGQLGYIEQLVEIIDYPNNKRIDDLIPDIYFDKGKGEYRFINGQTVPTSDDSPESRNTTIVGSTYYAQHRFYQENYMRKVVMPGIALMTLNSLEENCKELAVKISPEAINALYELCILAMQIAPPICKERGRELAKAIKTIQAAIPAK